MEGALDLLVRRERVRVDLNAHGARRMVAGAHLVQAEYLAGRVVESVMVDFDVSKGCVELDVDVALPGRELERGHGELVVGSAGFEGEDRGRVAGCTQSM